MFWNVGMNCFWNTVLVSTENTYQEPLECLQSFWRETLGHGHALHVEEITGHVPDTQLVDARIKMPLRVELRLLH